MSILIAVLLPVRPIDDGPATAFATTFFGLLIGDVRLNSMVDAGSLMTGAGDIFHIRAGINVRLGVGARLAAEFEDAVAEATQESAVVRD